MKNLYCTIIRTLGTIASTSKESFMEGWNDPYITEPFGDSEQEREFNRHASEDARHLDEELKKNASYL